MLQKLLSKVFRRKFLKAHYHKLKLESEPNNPSNPFKNKNMLFRLSLFDILFLLCCNYL